MSLNDSTIEGDYYNSHGIKVTEKQADVKKQDPYKVFAETVTEGLFKSTIRRRIYEGLKIARKYASFITFRRKG